MTKEEFIRRIDEVEARLEELRGRRGWTYGLCTYIEGCISQEARESFEKRFKLFSPDRKHPYWLGNIHSEEGYQNRLKYLAKFKTYSLRFWRYRRY